ncbi:A/G-specific adenine glycosylase [Desulforamulus ruminis]|uniref:Adenine DNA glycosylase n=1 Tax=Desulforamulus ruminis (strain ATCC 23193 / DSM 2154 / NCIMB 8452 / DL) TaxID=696281 RepID=F6DPZ5_DESRL|nr:A/G-specific adenine glycosylase [Desulforamulus ruminis]AEG61939.1 A/G-specific adenine glycosylase [Desulforamulus ruminis DSM 2154]
MPLNWVQSLLNWYRENKRNLPWREQKDPYAIWVSEIMLQQTRVDTVLDYYRRFLGRFPNMASLAEAELDEVLKYWEGLGYYTRARNLHRGAGEVMTKHRGVFPDNHRDVLALPGIGEYTAGAIMSIAFNEPYPAIDGNVLRVASRLFLLEQDIKSTGVKKEVEGLLKGVFPRQECSDFTQALMELGALICLPTSPKCQECPVQRDCKAYRHNRQQELPLKSKSGRQKKVQRYIAIVQERDRVLMGKRPERGLLGGLWEFPGVEGQNMEDFRQFKKEYNLEVTPCEHWIDTKHIFSHITWDMKVYRCSCRPEAIRESPLQWVYIQELHNIAIPTAFQKIREKILQEKNVSPTGTGR